AADGVNVHDRRSYLQRGRMDVQLREDALDIGAVMGRHLELRLDRVDRAFLRISRIRRTAHHDREDIRYAELGVEGIERPDEARRVARRHADELGAEAFLVVRRGVERKIRQRVFLAPLPDRLDAGLFVQGLVSAVLRGAVDVEVDRPRDIGVCIVARAAYYL